MFLHFSRFPSTRLGLRLRGGEPLWHHRTLAARLLLWRRTTSVQWGVFLSLRTQGSQPGDAVGYK